MWENEAGDVLTTIVRITRDSMARLPLSRRTDFFYRMWSDKEIKSQCLMVDTSFFNIFLLECNELVILNIKTTMLKNI